ncbi:ArnT family glycosyltransferase [Nocardia gamkensis]|uniref:Glycosyltransferase family 39 protein n=1 Tax=Nocardia gamkensis TaxID=352869 RepID=A0A7X6L4N2_9NOCA|nr:glycosyltransferase family 39 protein [Nocardia gamkensis]NKY27650.1 glycosyltransferase family 39 protein [Nocardia gamkensis]NQE67284.1 putative mannosyltransferase YycA [Nocardia gamkensis]
MASITSVPPGVEAVARPVGAHRASTHERSWADRAFFGPATQSRWARPALFALLLATAVLYFWNLTVSGWANEYYAAAAQAGTQSWKALLFGAHDAGNAITVDKPPASLWVMGLSGRLFGFGSWSLLAPQALMGVGSVALLYGAVRRWSGPGAGLLAGAALAATPVAALMFRFDNPDALLTLLLVAAAYCTVRAIDSHGLRWRSASTGWLALAGAVIGFAFLTKMMQAFLVLPALGLVFLVAAAGGFWARIVKLITACAAMVVAGGWYVLLVELWPADSRPYIGGSTDNSLWELALGYNGMGRLLGGSGNPSGGSGGPGGGGMGGAFGGDTGLARLFSGSMGTEVSWLLPAALIGLVAGLWLSRRAPRTDRLRAAMILWGGWLLGTGLVFSYMSGIIHPYYTVALAPGIAGVAGIAVTQLWRRRGHVAARMTLALLSAVTGVWAFVLLDRTPDWLPWLHWTVLISTALAAMGLLVGAHRSRGIAVTIAAAALLGGFAGSTAYAVETVTHAHSGGIPTSGPAQASSMGVPGGGAGADGPPADGRTGATDGTDLPTGDAAPSGSELPTGDMPAADGGRSTGDSTPASGAGGPSGNAGNAELDALLENTDSRWSAASIGSGTASSLELRTGTSVIAIGGFSGGDDAPTLAQFQQYVADGEVHYFVAQGQGMRPGSSGEKSAADEITEWVKAHFTAKTVGNITVYDLTAPTGS